MDEGAVIAIALALVAFALVSRRLETTIWTGPMLFAAIGLVIGQGGFQIASFNVDHGAVHGLVEITLVLVLFSDAARIQLNKVRSDHDLPKRMLVFGMPLAILFGTVAALALPLGLELWEAALLAAILAPTDAALGQSVVASPWVPARIRQALNVESGLNDGIALPFVLLFAYLAAEVTEPSSGRNWLLFAAAQIGFGAAAGMVFGGLAAWVIDRAVRAGWMAESYEGPAVLGAALFSFAGAEAIGGNGFISAFVAGMVFGNLVRGRCSFLFEFAEAEGQLLTLLTFLIFGAAMVPEIYGHLSWAMLAYAVLSLTVVRMVPIALSLWGAKLHRTTVLFLAWFGPRGLASILFALFVLEQTDLPQKETILPVVILTVCLSIVLHGLTAAPAARRYGRRMKADGEGPKPDSALRPEFIEVFELPTRSRKGFGDRTSSRDL